jgi:rubrerythrin
VNHSGTREFFQDFARQEEGHKKKLEGVLEGKVAQTKIEKIPDLKMSGTLVETSLKPDIPYADILRIAMKREERSVKRYMDLKNRNLDERLITLFNFLIQEESKHKFHLKNFTMMKY